MIYGFVRYMCNHQINKFFLSCLNIIVILTFFVNEFQQPCVHK